MVSVLISLLPLIIGSMLMPTQVILDILLLRSPERGLSKAIAYVGSMVVVRLIQGLMFGAVLVGEIDLRVEEPGSSGPILSTLLFVLGLILLITVFKRWQRGEDPDAPQPQWFVASDKISVLQAYGIGTAMQLFGTRFWIFTLTAIAMIGEAQLGRTLSILTYLIFVVLAEALLLVPIVIRVAQPERSKAILDQLSVWLIKNNRSIVMVVSLVFGLFFVVTGGRNLVQ